ncbi:MAG: serine/threonine-protein kinase [Gemmatimonadaceae bacterium]
MSADDPTAAALARALGAQYDVVRILGRGGMGVVYLARESFLERDVAVKVLPGEVAGGDARERFLREARTAARLSHPNIVPLYTFGQADDLLYYVMGFIDGETLETRLRREGRLPPDETRRITIELASALEYAHSLGVVHRDIKPDNVLLDRASGRAMLTDFGVAKQRAGLETLTQTGVIVGTPHYMSPEQGSGDRDIDGRSDIYSLGVMAYRMATGRLPFEGSALREVLVQHATRAPIPPTQIIPSLPLDLVTVITRALAKEPAERWPNAGAMREALSPESEESTPDALREIAGMGVNLCLITAGLLEFVFLGGVYGFLTRSEIVGVAVGAGTLPFLAALNAIPAARRFGWGPVWQSLFRQPSWWRSWWPRSLRRPGDVWDRMPREIRYVRSLNVLMIPVLITFPNYMLFTMRERFIVAHPAFHDSGFTRAVVFGTVALLYTLLGMRMWRLRQWVKRADISKSDHARILREPTAGSTFWSRPHIAALLQPAGGGARAPEPTPPPRAPADLLREVETLAREEETSPHATLFRDAGLAAAAICAAIAHADEGLGPLARELDPRERERIQSSLDALGAAGPQESVAKAQMRALLDQQLALFRDLGAQQENLSARRAHLYEQLRTLALQLTQLRAAGHLEQGASTQFTTRIEAICREVDYRIEGAAETRTLLSS